jgi:hypothetical protein
MILETDNKMCVESHKKMNLEDLFRRSHELQRCFILLDRIANSDNIQEPARVWLREVIAEIREAFHRVMDVIVKNNPVPKVW